MNVNSATINTASAAPRSAEPSRVSLVDASAKAQLRPNVVDISPIARARAQLVRAGGDGNVDFADPIKNVVGEGEPNAELRARVLGLIVGVLTD
ncbi:MAG: hypothetical protein VX265_02340, partial [Myxococcota bacterium]|nr:hypothetical protein [Myxococcota bacterium]